MPVYEVRWSGEGGEPLRDARFAAGDMGEALTVASGIEASGSALTLGALEVTVSHLVPTRTPPSAVDFSLPPDPGSTTPAWLPVLAGVLAGALGGTIVTILAWATRPW